MSLIRRAKLSLIALILLPLSASSCGGPEPTSVEYEDIDTWKDPVQTACNSDEIIPAKIKNGLFNIQPVAEYKASAKVVGKESYPSGWSGEIAPVDLALAWGKLGEPENEKYISFRQSDRWYFFEYKPSAPFAESYIINHSSNNHIIPATRNIRRAVKSVKVKEKVILEGFLVNLNGTYEGQRVLWNTSLSRSDAGDHSCELFYVTKVRIGNYIYQ